MANLSELEKIVSNTSKLNPTDLVYLEGKERYDRKWARDFLLNHTSIAEHDGDSCLDLACGDGFWSLILDEWLNVTGEDISPAGIYIGQKKANEEGKTINFEWVDSLKETKTFDVVFARGPSFWSNAAPDSKEFIDAIPTVMSRTNKKLIFVTFSKAPFGHNGQNSYYHDPDIMQVVFSDFGDTKVHYKNNYLTVEVSKK